MASYLSWENVVSGSYLKLINPMCSLWILAENLPTIYIFNNCSLQSLFIQFVGDWCIHVMFVLITKHVYLLYLVLNGI